MAVVSIYLPRLGDPSLRMRSVQNDIRLLVNVFVGVRAVCKAPAFGAVERGRRKIPVMVNENRRRMHGYKIISGLQRRAASPNS